VQTYYVAVHLAIRYLFSRPVQTQHDLICVRDKLGHYVIYMQVVEV